MKWAYISVMIATANVCSYVAAANVPVYQGVISLGIALGAIVTMFASLHGGYTASPSSRRNSSDIRSFETGQFGLQPRFPLLISEITLRQRR